MMRWLVLVLAVVLVPRAWALPGDGSYQGRISCAASMPHPTTGRTHPAWSAPLSLTITNGSLRGGAGGTRPSGVRWNETWNGSVRDDRVSVLAQGQDDRNEPWVYVMTGQVPRTGELVLHGTMYVLNQRHRVCEYRGRPAGRRG